MIVAVDTRYSKEYQEFIYQCFKRITENHPQHIFLFISDRPIEPSFNSENIIPVVVKQTKVSLFSQFKIASLLKQHKADVLVTGELLNIKISQCLISRDRTKFKSLNRATVIVANSEFSKKQITGKYSIDETAVDVVYDGVSEMFRSISLGQQEQVKEGYAEGHEFFLSVVSSGDELLNLLKAFSVFKKMQKSNMQLLVQFPKEMNAEFSETVRLYKFKSEVKFVNADTEELALVTASAYAIVYQLSGYQHALNAMGSGAPVLVRNKEPMHEICGDAALYFNPNDHKDISDKMMLVYKDEDLRRQLIEKGNSRIKKYTWTNSAEALWKIIEKAAN